MVTPPGSSGDEGHDIPPGGTGGTVAASTGEAALPLSPTASTVGAASLRTAEPIWTGSSTISPLLQRHSWGRRKPRKFPSHPLPDLLVSSCRRTWHLWRPRAAPPVNCWIMRLLRFWRQGGGINHFILEEAHGHGVAAWSEVEVVCFTVRHGWRNEAQYRSRCPVLASHVAVLVVARPASCQAYLHVCPACCALTAASLAEDLVRDGNLRKSGLPPSGDGGGSCQGRRNSGPRAARVWLKRCQHGAMCPGTFAELVAAACRWPEVLTTWPTWQQLVAPTRSNRSFSRGCRAEAGVGCHLDHRPPAGGGHRARSARFTPQECQVVDGADSPQVL